MFEFDGILLEPCLLQPCFHVAGPGPPLPGFQTGAILHSIQTVRET